MRRFLPLLLLIASGCAGTPVERLDDGTYRIDCSGGYHDWSRCLGAARRACGKYEVQDQITDESSSSVGVNNWEQEGSIVTRLMVVRCVEG